VLSLTLSCLIFGQANLSKPVYFENTDDLVGVVSRWPRGAALVFENQIQLLECDSIDAVEAWSPTHLKLKTAFGESVEIDVRKVRRVDSGIWSKKPSPITEVDINKLKGKFVGPSKQASGYVGQPGIRWAIGVSTIKRSFFTVIEEAKATMVRSDDGRLNISMPKGGTPVLIKDSGSYLAIMPGNSRFAPLKLISPGHSRTLVSDAQTFYALRFKRGS
jgi:hypothetical protein